MQESLSKRLSASQRQTSFVARKRAAGYVPLTAVYVPKAAIPECREVIKKFVAEWEAEQVEDQF